MNDPYRATLKKQLDKQYERVYLRHVNRDSDWGSLPESVKPPRNKLVRFAGHLWRRKGYLLVVNTTDLLSFLGGPKLGAVARRILQDRLCRNLSWQPLRLPLEGNKAKKLQLNDWETAAFMGEIGQAWLRMQAYQVDNSPASLACLCTIQEQGIISETCSEPLRPKHITIAY